MALVVLPVVLFDRVHAPLFLAAWAATFAAVWKINASHRACLGLLAVSIVVFVAGGEVYFRLRYFGPQGLSFDRYRPASYAHPWSVFAYDETTYTGLKPGERIIFQGQPFTVNHEGFRGGDYPRKKPSGTYRIVVAGPSATMGTGVADGETFPELMEAHWERNPPGGVRVEVINLAIGASRVGEMLHTLREVGLRYDPDLLLLCLNRTRLMQREIVVSFRKAREIEASAWEKFADKRFRFFSNRFFFMNLIQQWRVGRLDPRLDERSAVLPDGTLENNLAKVIDKFSDLAAGRRMGAYVLRPIARLDDPDLDRPFREKLRETMEREGIIWVDAYDIDVRGYRERDLMVYPGDKHPNHRLHALYAGKFIEVLDPVIRQDIGRVETPVRP